MPLGNEVKTDFIFKKIKGRRFTATEKEWYEEYPGSLVYLHADDVWSDPIPTPAPGSTTSVVHYYSDLKLTEDLSTPDHKAWLACETPGDTSTQLSGFIPPRYHQSYTIRLFEDDGSGGMGNEVPTAHPSNWIFDYENGVLKFENDPIAAGLTGPFHVMVYRYIGTTVSGSQSSTTSKLRAFLRQASDVSVSNGSNSVDVSSAMSGKTAGGGVSNTGVVTTTPYNRCPIVDATSRDQIMTDDGNKVYGRLTESGGTWTLSFYYVDNSGTETAYTFDVDTTISWGYYEVLEFNDWPVFDDDAVLPSDQIVGEIPDATTSQFGKVILAEDNETSSNEVVRSDDPRAIKAVDFKLDISSDGTNITIDVGPGVYNSNGDKTAAYSTTTPVVNSAYYLIKVDTTNGTVSVVNDTSNPPTTGGTEIALYRWTTDASGNLSVVEDVRPIYTIGTGGGYGPLGTPPDGTYEDGLLDFTSDTLVNDSIDQINEVLLYLAPDDAQPLSGPINWQTTFTTGKIAGNVSTLYLTAGSTSTMITRDTTFDGLTPDQGSRFHKADVGVLNAIINDSNVDSFDLGSHFNESERNGAQSYPPADSSTGTITVTSVEWYNSFPLWQKGNATIHIVNATTGDIKVKLQHDIDGGTTIEETNEDILFIDDETARPGISSGPTVSEGTPQYKWLSGVRFYGLNSTFNVSTTSDTHLFEYTYVDEPIRFTMTGMNDVSVAITDSAVSGVSSPPQYNEQMTITNKGITLDNANQSGENVKLTVTPSDPWGDGTPATESITDNRLINTYGNVSTTLVDEFQDENYRLPTTWNFDDTSSAITGNWDSTQALSNGDAQVFNGRLIYPSTDYTSGYLPSQTVNYSTFSGDQVFYRAFEQNGTPHNSGRIALGGLTWSDIGTNVDVHIKLPTQTGWLDLSKDFNAATFTGADGEGAMTGHSESGGVLYIDWSSGTFSTADSGYRYYIRITLKNANKDITHLEEVNW